jgi:hypothetical protein
MLHWVWKNAETIGNIATAFAACFAILGLLFAWVQISSNARLAREMDARRTYDEYLKLCVDMPEYSCSGLAREQIGIGSFVGILDVVSVKSEKYLWFVSIMLNACEKILFNAPNSKAWRATIEDQIDYHLPLFDCAWDRMRHHYDPPLCKIVDSKLSDYRSQRGGTAS